MSFTPRSNNRANSAVVLQSLVERGLMGRFLEPQAIWALQCASSTLFSVCEHVNATWVPSDFSLTWPGRSPTPPPDRQQLAELSLRCATHDNAPFVMGAGGLSIDVFNEIQSQLKFTVTYVPFTVSAAAGLHYTTASPSKIFKKLV